LICSTNLATALKIIVCLWKQEYQNKNVPDIARQGGALYAVFVRLSENLIKLGKKIDDTSVHYKDTMKDIESPRQPGRPG
jgi:DNA recombination protein RmuC